jgi:hypothetical protein
MNDPHTNPLAVEQARADAGSRLKVLFIAGNGRSGSTLLDSILGQLPGFFAVGEVRQIWDEGMVENRLCGCGTPVHDCPVWRAVLEQLTGHHAISGQHMGRLREQLAQTKRLVPMIATPGRYHRRTVPGLNQFLEATNRLYQSVAEVTQCRVIVDSSKWPTYTFLLDLLPDVDLYVLHLVRDPRACAFSWTRGKETEPGKPIGLQTASYTTAYWLAWNPAIRHFWLRRADRYRFLRYEDFVNRPRPTIESIVDFVGASVTDLPFVDDHTVTMARTHAIAGNSTKFADGAVRLSLDDEWRRKMPRGRRWLVTAMTWPLLWRYGYFPARSSTARD